VNAVQLVGIVLRLFSAWLGFKALQTAALSLVVHPTLSGTAVISYAVAAGYLAGGVCCWRLARPLARRFVPEPQSDGLPLTERGLTAAALVMAGLLCIAVTGLQDLGDFATLATMLVVSGQGERLGQASVNITGLIGLAKVLFGAVLVFKAQAIAARLTPGTAGDRVARRGGQVVDPGRGPVQRHHVPDHL